jgi:hypothetical protein
MKISPYGIAVDTAKAVDTAIALQFLLNVYCKNAVDLQYSLA